jgi:hypothetical protein
MAKTMHAVDLDFLESAPSRVTAQVRLEHPIEAVFAAIASQPAEWGSWYPGFGKDGKYVTPGPPGVGSVREMKVGGLPVTETILAWEEPSRWAFSILKATMPGVRALAEDYKLSTEGSGTVLAWTLALELAPAAALMSPLMGRLGPVLTRRAFANLDRHLSRQLTGG